MIRNKGNKTTRTLIIIMGVLVLLGTGIASFYYNEQNKNVDPRIRNARTLYEKYNEYAGHGYFDSVFYLMDTIESVYNQYDHYNHSFEKGVLYNNRAAALLTMMIIQDSSNTSLSDSLLVNAKENIKKSISIYQNWKSRFPSTGKNQICDTIQDEFFQDLHENDQKLKQRILSNRINEIKTALEENERRLSVCYTNLGIVYRHEGRYDDAAKCYKKALDLWDMNLTAENNLNILLNRPLKKRNIIQILFPPDKKAD